MISGMGNDCFETERLAKLLNCDCLCSIDTKTGKFEVMQAGCNLSQNTEAARDYDTYIREYLEKNDVPDHLEEDIAALQIAAIAEHLEKEICYTYEIGIRENGSVRQKQIRCMYADCKAGQILLNCMDIEDIVRKGRDRQMELQRELTEAKDANQAKSDFLIHMSHDIRTPISSVIGMTSIAKEESEDEKIKGYLEKIETTSKFFLGLLNDMLDISKIESGTMVLNKEKLCLEEFNLSICHMLEPMLQKQGVSYEYKNNYHARYVYTDIVRFKQVFFNLISNAVKYTPAGGKVLFEIGYLRGEGKTEWVRFQVKDTGIGMSREFMERAFEPFEQEQVRNVAESWRGTGLGLPIVKKLVGMMQGSVQIESEQGRGTAVTVDLPLEAAEWEDAVPQKKEAAGNVPLLLGKRVLVVEDNSINLFVAGHILKNRGIFVETATNGQEALEAVWKSPEHYYDAILMDVRMPVTDGLAATRNIRALERMDVKNMPIIAMSANAYDEDREKSLHAGMNAHLTKPVEPELLLETLARCIADAL